MPNESPGDLASDCELSIVMPCLNEARTVGICVAMALRFLQQEGICGEVVVADNGSSDGSQEIAIMAGARVVSVEEKGYGNALRGGIAAARGRYIIMGDSDDSYDFLSLGPFVEKLREGYDLVMGNRFKGGIAPGAMPGSHRYLGSPVLTALGRLFFGTPCGDFHCGLRGFSKHAYQRIDPHTTGMEFASEIVVKASLLNMRIAEVPTTLSPDGRGRPSHLRSWRDGWRHLRFLLLYSPRWLFMMPGLALLLTGGALGAILTWTPVRVGNVVFDTNTILVCAMCALVGFQLICFSVFAKAFALREGLMPVDEKTQRFLRGANLEIGLMIGVGILALGLALLLWAVLIWEEHGFGDLSYPDSLRVTIPSVTPIMLGLQVIFSSFLLSLFSLRVK